MKALLITLALTVGATTHALADECKVTNTNEKNEYIVANNSEEPIGYISPNENGTWFVWIDNLGAVNQSFLNKEEALQYLCLKAKDKGQEHY